MNRWLAALALLCLLLPAAGATQAPAVALFYGKDAPLAELKAFDIVVVDPDHGHDPQRYCKPYSELYAYVAVGEAHPGRGYFAAIPAAARLAENRDWGSLVVDLAHHGWPDFVAANIVGPLWERGYRGFFLDTLDSYRLAERFDEAAQQAGLVAVIETLHRRFPGIRLILNRGFEVVPKVRDKLQMVAAESLFRGWDAANKRYVDVRAEDRDWLLGQLRAVRDQYNLPVLAIDYVDAQDRALTRATAERIKALGIVPWVADAALGTFGIGQREVVPRRVLMLYDGREAPTVDLTALVRYAAMPINHLGYATDFHDLNRPLPDGPLTARYAGAVLWTNRDALRAPAFAGWLRRQIDAGLRVAVFGHFGFPLDAANARALGLAPVTPPAAPGKPTIAHQDPLFGFEEKPRPDRRALPPLRLAGDGGQPLLQLADAQGARYDAAAFTRWGGYVLDPYTVITLPGSEQARWIVDPFAFLQRALALPAMPVPDTTTENGRRLLFIHIDGDGYPSLAELPGTPIAGRALLEQVIEKYKLPTTMSVIEGEVAPHGLFPKLAAEMEETARRTFALPYVEIASHTYSHPFVWFRAERPAARADDAGYHLRIPGYTLDLAREITGSVDYIRTRLAPPGKPVRVLLWSGDAEPQANALRIAEDAGLLNLNGGNTVISRSNPSLTAVSPLGLAKGGVFQTYAPVMNENVFTNLWTGPFYGYERVIETFRLTGSPRRLKPINIYYHSYSASKQASLNALHKVYAWALAQSPHVVFASDFIRKARDFDGIVVARDGDGWRIRGDGELRTLRAPAALGRPDPGASLAVAGHAAGSEGHYVHLAGGDALLRFAETPAGRPYLHDANARLAAWQADGDGLRFVLQGHQPLDFALAGSRGCVTRADGRPLTPRRSDGDLQHFRLDHAAATIETRCRGR
ncbi:bifunctional glycoside hydrolase 114/ polysaccharide deacetylase family protein [Azospira restricta]|uniref:bifunctional glycoside hydrolase 114/ polysaccharide deacetylase family protein n=1 Tax=Azospira restricta TaxID=404405 RepID=UPI00193C368C|nr:bifunctional glycoside hydrolase 114/ polysaccharide deacetylase family protein [Azospira restricta]